MLWWWGENGQSQRETGDHLHVGRWPSDVRPERKSVRADWDRAAGACRVGAPWRERTHRHVTLQKTSNAFLGSSSCLPCCWSSAITDARQNRATPSHTSTDFIVCLKCREKHTFWKHRCLKQLQLRKYVLASTLLASCFIWATEIESWSIVVSI